MTEAEISKKLINRAGALLGRRAYSRAEIRRKLLRYAEEDRVEEVLDRLEELKLLNDSEYAYNFALCRMKEEGWGPLKVLDALRRRDVPAHIAEMAVESVRRESDDSLLLSDYLQKHARKHSIPRDRKGIAKLISHLRRRGFEDEVIIHALRGYIPAAAWQSYEIGD